MKDTIAAWAAVAAAVFSLVNVLISNQFLRRSQTQQWRRDSGRKLMVEFCEEMRETRSHWRKAVSIAEEFRASSPDDPRLPFDFSRWFGTQFDEAASEARAAAARATRLQEEIQLIMSGTCHEAASQYWYACFAPITSALKAESAIVEAQLSSQDEDASDKAHGVFISACRADLGIGPKPFEYTFLGFWIEGVVELFNARRSARNERASGQAPANE